MTTFSYTITPRLESTIAALDALRVKFLLTPLTPKTELNLKWESIIDRVYFSLILSGMKLERKSIESILSKSILKKPKKLSQDEKTILRYKRAVDIIAHNWFASEKTLTPEIVLSIYSLISDGRYKKKNEDLHHILEYIQKGTDHTIVQAAIAYVAIIDLDAFTDDNKRLAGLVSLLLLYKEGFYYRSLICIEKEWTENKDEFKEALSDGLSNIHMTTWIEYFASSLARQLGERLIDIENAKQHINMEKNTIHLNDRQKEIISLLDEPGSSITNRKVQKYFEISQITASRDLTQLSVLGLLIPHGHGRSVYYTRV